MTKEEAIAALNTVSWDSEIGHGEADAILLDVLRTNGFEEVAKAWSAVRERIIFWYA